MHVRFRPVGGRLVVDLENGRRVLGKTRIDYIGTLGRVRLPLTAVDRARFWSELDGRFRRLDNPVSDADRRKALALIDARIPRPTRQELREVIEEMSRAIAALAA